MTDNEIIKALECCENRNQKCEECPYYSKHYCVERDALDLINRQKEELDGKDVEIMRFKHEIERYKENEKFISAKCDSIQEKLVILNSEIAKALATAKADAYLKFVVRALKRIGFIEHTNATVRGHINKVYEELLEE